MAGKKRSDVIGTFGTVLKEESLGPLRVGFFYGALAALVALYSHFFFLFMDPEGTSEWMLAATTDFLPLASLAAYIFLGVIAALRVRPTHIDPDVPYRSQVMRDAALAAVVVAVVVSLVNIVATALQATVFAGQIESFASAAAPHIVDYVNDLGRELSDPPPPTSIEQVRGVLQPPSLGDLGRTLGNAAIGTIALGALGAGIGALRGRSYGRDADPDVSSAKS